MTFLASFEAKAQDLADVVGTVTDSSGAVIPDAQVMVANPDLGFVRRVVSDASGEYQASRVPIGNYTLTVEKPGFGKLVRSGITLQVGQTLRVDLQIAPGASTQEVVVNAGASHVETETSDISDVVTGTQVSELNLNARSFSNLALLVPGAASLGSGYDPTSFGPNANAAISFNGLPVSIQNWEVDGTNNISQGSGSGTIQTYPSIDSIAEFRVSTQNYSAEFPKAGGAQIEVVTKSGTKEFHGDVFEFVRNDDFDANNWFINRTVEPNGESAPQTPLHRNDYGFTLGGPVFIPSHYNTDKEKTFFFVSEEWRKNTQGTVFSSPVPSLLERQGNFSQCDPSSKNYNAVVASGCAVPTMPGTTTPFPNDIVPITPDGLALLNALIPLPSNGIDTYTAAPSTPYNFREDMFKIDQNFTENFRAFFRYTQDSNVQDFVPSVFSPSTLPTVQSTLVIPTKSVVLHLIQTIRPNLLNEFIASYSDDTWTVNNSTGYDSPAGSINKPSDFALNSLFPGNAGQPFLPGVSLSGGVPFSITQTTGFKQFFSDPQPAIKDNVIWEHGAHTVKTGFYLLYNHADTTTDINEFTQGFLTFSNTSSVTTGNALADMYLGKIANYQEYGRVANGQPLGGDVEGHWRQWDFEPYVQDDWHVTSHLTLNLGLRYYWFSPYYDISSPTNDSNFVPSLYNPAAQAQLNSSGYLIPGTGATYLNYGNGLVECGSGGVPRGCSNSFHGTFSPRFGFAWDPFGDGKTAIRGGYGLTWDGGNFLQNAAGFNGNPPTATNLFSYNIPNYASVAPGPLGPAYFTNMNFTKWQDISQWNFGIQHEFPGNNVLAVSYVANEGHHLQQNVNIDQVPIGVTTENVPALAGTPGCSAKGNCNVQYILENTLEPSIFFVPYRGYSQIEQRQMTGNSNYNSLQAKFRHTLGHGLVFQAAYTWSHELDNMFQGGSCNCNSTNGVNDDNLNRWYGTGALNQPQMLVLNYVYTVPFFKNAQNRVARTVLSGWQISGISSFLAGTPLTVQCGIAGMASGIGQAVQCNSLGHLDVQKGTIDDPQFGPTPSWFNPALLGQITIPQLAANNEPGMFGYMGKDALQGPGRDNWDLAILRNFSAPWFHGEHSSVQFRAESFNTFNHPQWTAVNISCSSLTAPGAACNGPNNIGNGEVSAAAPARVLQLGLKFLF